jgi:hypothetical protein
MPKLIITFLVAHFPLGVFLFLELSKLDKQGDISCFVMLRYGMPYFLLGFIVGLLYICSLVIRSHNLSGRVKVLWVILVLLLPAFVPVLAWWLLVRAMKI